MKRLYFFANDGIHGEELWKSDGTVTGTLMVKDVWPGSSDSLDASYPELNCQDGTVYFTANDGIHGCELWRSDGTEAGTVMVKDCVPGKDDSFIFSRTIMNGSLYFFANYHDSVTYENGLALWKSDGTESGTVIVRKLGGCSAGTLAALNGALYFFSNSGAPYRNLWKSDGTEAGTVMVKAFRQNLTDSRLAGLDGALYFLNWNLNGKIELWKTDGSAPGTVMLRDFGGPYQGGAEDADALTVMNGALYFTADDGVSGQEVWRSDGTAAGTALLKDVYPGPTGASVLDVRNVGGKLYFQANDGIHGLELWQSDGATAGTTLLKDINPRPEIRPFGCSLSPAPLEDGKGTILFSADDGCHGNELWKSDGTTSGTVLVKNIANGDDSYPGLMSANGTSLYFTAWDGVHGAELWQSQGTAASTRLVTDIRPGTTSSLSLENGILDIVTTTTRGWLNSRIRPLDGAIYFTATDGVHGIGLWRTSGATSVTVVKDGFDALSELFVTSHTLYFLADDSVNGLNFWKSDGTPGGTAVVKRVGTTTGFDLSDYNMVLANGLFFFYSHDSNNAGIWRSDGSPAGTVKISSQNVCGKMVSVNDTVFFPSTIPWSGTELWKIDGSGVSRVKDILPGSDSAELKNLTVAGNLLFFTLDDGIHGTELWKSDGTETGTLMVKDIAAGVASSTPGNLAAVGGTLYFSADDGLHGAELWKSDGTAAGTVQVGDICPGALGSHPRNLAAVDGTLYFCAYSPLYGDELWKSDGTDAGTRLAADVTPGPKGSNPAGMTLAGGILYFSANNTNTPQGRELWAIRLSQISAAGVWRVYE